MKNRIKIFSVLMLTLLLALSAPLSLEAQCPMCKMAAESNLEEGGSAGKGLNKGILLMFAMPYVLVGTIGFIWYKNRRKEEDWDYEAV